MLPETDEDDVLHLESVYHLSQVFISKGGRPG